MWLAQGCAGGLRALFHARTHATLTRTRTFHAHARARYTRTRTGDISQLSELKASTSERRDAFLQDVGSALDCHPFTFSGLTISRKEGDTHLCEEGAVDKVNALINAVGSGITGSQAQARGGAFCVCCAPAQPQPRPTRHAPACAHL